MGAGTRTAAPPVLDTPIAEGRAVIWRFGAERGEMMTATNALQMIRRTAFAGWFPVQAGVADRHPAHAPRNAASRTLP